MHRNSSLWHWCWDIPATTVATRFCGWNKYTCMQRDKDMDTPTRGELQNGRRSHIHTAGVQGDSQSRAHLLSIAIDCWCYYALSSQCGSAISPLMTMIHSVWSDNSVYPSANDWEWKSEKMIEAYVEATASVPTQSGQNTHTHKLSRRITTVRTHSCAVHLCSVHCQYWACHAYSPPRSGIVWKRSPLHLVTPPSRTSDFFSWQETLSLNTDF